MAKDITHSEFHNVKFWFNKSVQLLQKLLLLSLVAGAYRCKWRDIHDVEDKQGKPWCESRRSDILHCSRWLLIPRPTSARIRASRQARNACETATACISWPRGSKKPILNVSIMCSWAGAIYWFRIAWQSHVRETVRLAGRIPSRASWQASYPWKSATASACISPSCWFKKSILNASTVLRLAGANPSYPFNR